jgi:site-specific DNA-methyltransferase (cytosine-N4-specific)
VDAGAEASRVAAVLGRVGVSVDRSADYCRLATWRTTDPGERARALRVPKPEPVAETQLALDLLSAGAA